ncbi:MAG: MFS transporter [Betaproteobacteria bacterium]
MTSVAAPVGSLATRREWIGLAVLALPCILYSMDLTVLNLALPHLTADLKPSSAQLLWIVDIYGFMIAGTLITMGTLGDRIGRRRLLMIGAAAFGIASVLAAFSTSAAMLIATRALLGIAGATLAPSTLSLIRNMFLDPAQRTFAIGVWITSYSAGGAIGPLLGGMMLEYFWWGSVFLIGVPVMVLLLVLGPVLLPEFRDRNARRLDLLSAALSLAAVLATIYGLKRMAEHGIDPWSASSIAIGIAIGIVFIRRQRELADPLIDVRLFRAAAFSVPLAAYTLATFVVFGAFLFIGQYLQLVLDLSPFQAGQWTLPSMMSFIFGSMLTPLIVRKIRPGFVMAAGLMLAALGFALLAQIDSGAGVTLVVLASIAYSLGLAPVFTLATDLIVGTAPAERAGAASAISETSSEFGGALGIAILGSIGTAIYRGHMTDALPKGVPVMAAEAARNTLGGAVSAASQLATPLNAALLDVAREAFTQALHAVAVIAALVMIATAVMTAILLRRVRERQSTSEATV